MEFLWFNLFNREQFPEDLVSREMTFILTGIGEKSVLVTKGAEFSITYEGVFLPMFFRGKNPYIREGYAVYVDTNQNVWLGVEIE